MREEANNGERCIRVTSGSSRKKKAVLHREETEARASEPGGIRKNRTKETRGNDGEDSERAGGETRRQQGKESCEEEVQEESEEEEEREAAVSGKKKSPGIGGKKN